MAELSFEHDAAKARGGGDDGVLDADDLRELMRAFNETTQRLESTHIALQKEVGRLRGELAEANAQLRRSRALAALGQMAAGIAHEIRNPLASIRLYVQMLEEDLDDRPEEAGLCGKIAGAVTRLDAIVRDVLLFAREMAVRRSPTGVRELVAQTRESCEALLASAGVEVEVGLADDWDGELEADAGLLSQALGNVVRNSVEAMVEHDSPVRKISISADQRRVRCPGGKQEKRVVVAVEDSGPGIPPEVVERMFNPFFTTRKTGTGLGLAIVHRIVDAHGGHINVKRLPRGGARVEMCLPRRAGDDRGRGASATSPGVEVVACDPTPRRNGQPAERRHLALEGAP